MSLTPLVYTVDKNKEKKDNNECFEPFTFENTFVKMNVPVLSGSGFHKNHPITFIIMNHIVLHRDRRDHLHLTNQVLQS